MSKQIKRFSGTISDDYALLPQAIPSYFELQLRLAKQIASKFRRFIAIDIGVGTGLTTSAILSEAQGCLVRAVDDEPRMLVQARARLKVEIAEGIVEIYESDAVEFLRTQLSSSADVV